MMKLSDKEQKDIKDAEAELNLLDIKVGVLQAKKRACRNKIFNIHENFLKTYLKDNVIISYESEERLTTEKVYISDWDCKESPIGFCCNDATDQEETCIFCSNPDERK